MAFTDQQTRLLRAKLDAQFVKTRKADGNTLHYIEGWHAIAEANRIFGFAGWDRRTLATNCVWTGTCRNLYIATYTAKVRIYVRAGDVTVIREGTGTGEAKAPSPGEAHDVAIKSAETDATKRALATFGNVFGLALYDPEQAGVRQRAASLPSGPWLLRSAEGSNKASHEKPAGFVKALRQEMASAPDIESLFGVWEHNVSVVRALNALKQKTGLAPGFAQSLVAHLKACAIQLVKPTETAKAEPNPRATISGSKIDKSVLAIAEPKRIRSREHLRFVARQPCLICGRTPSHAHHIRYAQSRGLGIKASDEFTVPLCAIHHTEIHATGDEPRWWEKHKIDPIPIARSLWKEGRMPPTSSIQEHHDTDPAPADTQPKGQ